MLYFSQHRKLRREVDGSGRDQYQNSLAVQPGQYGHLDLADFRSALSVLPADQRAWQLLWAAEGFSYEEAAEICGMRRRHHQEPSQPGPQ